MALNQILHYLLLVAVVALLSPCCHAVYIVNAGFETGDLTGWNILDVGPIPKVVDTYAHTGKYSVLLDTAPYYGTQNVSFLYQQNIYVPEVSGFADIYLSFWWRANTTDVALSITFAGEDYTKSFTSDYLSEYPRWRFASFGFDTLYSGFYNLTLSLNSPPNDDPLSEQENALVYLDDFAIGGVFLAPLWQDPSFVAPTLAATTYDSIPAPQPAPNAGSAGNIACFHDDDAYFNDVEDEGFGTSWYDHAEFGVEQQNEWDHWIGPPLYFGNTFQITDILPQNSTYPDGELTFHGAVFDYFDFNTLTNATDYNLLVRVIGVVRKQNVVNGSQPRHIHPGNPHDCVGYTQGCYNTIITPLTYASFPVLPVNWTTAVNGSYAENNSAGLPDFAASIANDTDPLAPQSIWLWASNPSGLPWANPASGAWNVSGLPLGDIDWFAFEFLPSAGVAWYQEDGFFGEGVYSDYKPFWFEDDSCRWSTDQNVELRWQVACQRADGSDCNWPDPALPVSNNSAAVACGVVDTITVANSENGLTGFGHWFDSTTGLCWQDVHPAWGRYQLPPTSYDSSHPRFAGEDGRLLNRIKTSLRPLSLLDIDSADYFVMPGIDDIGIGSFIELELFPGTDSDNVIVSLPIEPTTVVNITEATLTPNDYGTTQYPFTQRFVPGVDNAGGSLTVSVQAIYSYDSDTSLFTRADDAFQMRPSSLTLTADAPSQVFQFRDVPRPTGVLNYVVYLDVAESNPSTLASSGQNSFGTYNNGAYGIPAVLITFIDYLIQFDNWPFASGDLPILVQPADACSKPSQVYLIELLKIPADMGLSSVVLPFNTTGGLTLYQCGSTSKRQTAGDTLEPISAFTFTGDQKAVNFVIGTQAFPFLGATITFAEHVLTYGTENITGIAFEYEFAGSTYTFDIIANEVQVSSSFGSTLGPTGLPMPFVYEEFYIQLEWTPPLQNGFTVQIEALYTTFQNANRALRDGTTAQYDVPAGSTAFAVGPLSAAAPSNLPLAQVTFTLPFIVSIVPTPGANASDDTWYQMVSPLQLIQFQRHRFVLANDISTFVGDDGAIAVPLNGQPTPPICVAVVSPLVFGADGDSAQGVWLTPVPNYPGLIVETVTSSGAPKVEPYSEVQPANSTLYFSLSSTVACFTVHIDTVQFSYLYTDPIYMSSSWNLMFFSAGPLADQLQQDSAVDVVGLNVSFYPDTIDFNVAFGGSLISSLLMDAYFGQTLPMLVWIDQPPLHGFSYTLSLPGAHLTPVSPSTNAGGANGAVGTFEPGGSLEHLWSVTFDIALPHQSYDEGDYGDDNTANPEPLWLSTLQAAFTGADAQLVHLDDFLAYVKIYARTVSSVLLTTSSPVVAGYSTPVATVSLGTEFAPTTAVNGLTVTPVLVFDSLGNTDAVQFEPSSYTFSSTTPTSVTFFVTGFVPGSYTFSFQLSSASEPAFDSDANFFAWYNDGKYYEQINAPFYTLSVTTRSLPTLSLLSGDGSLRAGTTYGPLVAQLSPLSPLLPGEQLNLTLEGGDVQFTPSWFVLSSTTPQALFTAQWIPTAAGTHTQSSTPLAVFWGLSASGAASQSWYSLTGAAALLLTGVTRSIALNLPGDQFVVGVRYTGNVQLTAPQLAPPDAIDVVVSAPDVQFFTPGSTTGSSSLTLSFAPGGGVVQHFEFVLTTGSWNLSSTGVNLDASVSTQLASVLFTAVVDPASPGYAFFAGQSSSAEGNVVRRSVLFDAGQQSYHGHILNRLLPGQGQVFMLNHPSPWYTVSLTTPVSDSALQLTFSHPNLQFTPATLAFEPGQLSKQFYFTPVSLPTTVSVPPPIDISLAGAEASLYEYWELVRALSYVQIIPELGFSPIPALYTDGSVDQLSVWLLNQSTALSIADNQFTLHIVVPSQDNVIVQPSALEFSTFSLASGALSQQYSIQHVRQASFCAGGSAVNAYWLQWLLRFEGLPDMVDITAYVPLDAQRVIVMRYQILPLFPDVLNFGWQLAAFNLTRGPLASLALVPHQAYEDGQAAGQSYGGSSSAGGRLVFDPAVITFEPGQVLAQFKVQAIAGNVQQQVYYRVQWHMEAALDDACNYLDYAYPRRDGGSQPFIGEPSLETEFSTWHVALASTRALNWALVALVFFFLLPLWT